MKNDGGKRYICGTACETDKCRFVALESKDGADICDTGTKCGDGTDYCYMDEAGLLNVRRATRRRPGLCATLYEYNPNIGKRN